MRARAFVDLEARRRAFRTVRKSRAKSLYLHLVIADVIFERVPVVEARRIEEIRDE